MSKVNDKIHSNECNEELVKEAKELVSKVSHYQFDIENEMMEIDDCIYIPNALAKHIYVDQISSIDPTLKHLL